MTVQQVFSLIDAVAPFETQLEYDNSGLLIGSPSAEVTGILFALDVTDRVIDEALSLGADLIVTHHPLLFNAVHRITDEDYEGRLIMKMIRSGLSLISAHTNLDQAPSGINDALAEIVGLKDVTGEGFVRVGLSPVPLKASEWAAHLSAVLHTTVRLMGDPDKTIARIGLCSGSGGDEWKKAKELGAEGFVSGEIKHHFALEMADDGITAFECGHFATEEPGIFALADALQSAFNQVEYKLGVYKSEAGAYRFPSRCDKGGFADGTV